MILNNDLIQLNLHLVYVCNTKQPCMPSISVYCNTFYIEKLIIFFVNSDFRKEKARSQAEAWYMGERVGSSFCPPHSYVYTCVLMRGTLITTFFLSLPQWKRYKLKFIQMKVMIFYFINMQWLIIFDEVVIIIIIFNEII